MAQNTHIFTIGPYDTDHLLSQVSQALEKRTELLSREQYPGLWRQTDRLRASAGEKKRSPARTKGVSLACVAVGLFLLIPGLAKPRELLVPLLAGAAAVIYGGIGLWRARGKKTNPFEASARKLLDGKDASPAEPITVAFTEEGMTIPSDTDDAETVPYAEISCTVETAELFLLVYGERITILQKQDLTQGSSVELAELLSEKADRYARV